MLNKIKSIFFFVIFIGFLIFIIVYYFSDTNKNKINKNRLNLSNKITESINEIPYLKNDTENIINYPDSNSEKEKVKKRYFWDLLK